MGTLKKFIMLIIQRKKNMEKKIPVLVNLKQKKADKKYPSLFKIL